MVYWFESISRPPEMDQPKVRKLGVFKSAAIITCNQPFDQGIVDLIEEYLCFKKNSIDFPFKSGPCFSFTWPKKVHHLSSDGSTDVNNRPRVLVTLALALAEAIPESGVYCAGSITSSGFQRSPSQAATSQVWAFTPNKMCLFHGNCAHCTFLLNEKTGHWYHPCVATMSSGSPAGINIPSKAWSSDIFDTFVLLIYIQMIIKARSDHQRNSNYDPHLTPLIWWKVTWLGFLTTPSLEPRNT